MEKLFLFSWSPKHVQERRRTHVCLAHPFQDRGKPQISFAQQKLLKDRSDNLQIRASTCLVVGPAQQTKSGPRLPFFPSFSQGILTWRGRGSCSPKRVINKARRLIEYTALHAAVCGRLWLWLRSYARRIIFARVGLCAGRRPRTHQLNEKREDTEEHEKLKKENNVLVVISGWVPKHQQHSAGGERVR